MNLEMTFLAFMVIFLVIKVSALERQVDRLLLKMNRQESQDEP